ncbi:hypothetical protein K9692_003711 [Escherichia coli]|jgi:hypothetical protein|uniref:hypothetical protein n=1 Tax=Buttiauxella gaviniae TaxID=82990 RepID=UPI001D7E8F28|nr:hypothetical protein [Escherichia coli]
MSANKVRSNTLMNLLSQSYPALLEASHKEINKKLKSTLLKVTERDNDLIVVLSEDKFDLIELKTLRPLSDLSQCIAANNFYFHVDVVEVEIKKIDFNKAVKLMKQTPTIPLTKSLAELDKILVEEFTKFGLDTFLDVENLDYSLEKASELKNDMLYKWVSDIIIKRDRLMLRERFISATNAHYNTVDELYNGVRPLLKELDFPDELMNHSFSELRVFNPKGWDYAIQPRIDFLAKREFQFIEDANKVNNLEVLKQTYLEQPANSALWAKTNSSSNGLALVSVAIAAILLIKNFVY